MRLIISFMVITGAFFWEPLLAQTNTHNLSPAAALQLNWLDKTVSPCVDFYTYANGTWQKHNPIPAQYSRWGTFSILEEKTHKAIHDLLIQAAANKSARVGSIEQKVGDFYFSGMDEASINKLGAAPLLPQFERIESIKNIYDLQSVITDLHMMGVDVFFDFSSMQDFKNSKEMIGVASQGGLSLPDRDYYLKDDEKFRQIREAYVRHVTKMFELMGDKPADAAKGAAIVMAIETTFAKASMTQTEQRDLKAIYNMRGLSQLKQLTPNFSWSQYFTAIGLPKINYINVAMPEFFKMMNEQLQSRPLDEWKIYLRWHLIDAFAPYLSTSFVEQDFRMNSVLSGAKKLLPRWLRVVQTENRALGFAIGKLYVKKYFPPEAKKEVLDILQNIRKALREDLQTLSWMTPATREAALKKLALIEERVGYPEKWWDYSALLIDRGPYVLNVSRANTFLIKRALNKIGKPVDRSEWGMTPQTINAYYDPSMNNINLPAAILQPPFFDPSAPAAINYGAIGFVIGHELTHGFDDQGAQFDGYGNLKNWWKPLDLEKFKRATDCIVTQFSQYKIGTLPVQGKLVVGEAAADLGGLTLAYRAFLASKDYKEAKTIDGFTPLQQFFLGTAHVWAGNIRPEQARNLIMTDPHPPMIYRVNGTLANMPAFQEAFAVKGVCPMSNVKQCAIW
ncbi:MAG: M13 family metallopeptidase [Legionella sp.]|nr:M13 family metallopeptidase [Legionella sp.]